MVVSQGLKLSGDVRCEQPANFLDECSAVIDGTSAPVCADSDLGGFEETGPSVHWVRRRSGNRLEAKASDLSRRARFLAQLGLPTL